MKVLMLGWEFPPIFSGGLGVATYGLVKALSDLSSIRLILPHAGNVTDLNHTSIIGLNRLSQQEINTERLRFQFHFSNTQIENVPVAVSPYHFQNDMLGDQHRLTASLLEQGKITLASINSIFSGKEVYGPDILWRVSLYASLAEELASDGNFDVIHAHDWVTYLAGVKIKKRTGKPLLLHVHALETDRAGEGARNEIYDLEKFGLHHADRIIAVSEYTKKQIVTHYEINPQKIDIVHNGIDPVPTQRKSHTLQDKLVVFLGRITHQKGPQFLLETAEKLVHVFPRVKFVVAGTGDQFAHLLETSAYKKLGSKFIFAGFLSKAKVEELLSMADVYFMPSVSEPFGLTALEAAQYKVPGVLSAQSGAAEVVTASLRADFWDTTKYANYIHALLRYAALHNEIAQKAFLESEALTWKLAARKIMSIYHETLVSVNP